MRLALDEAALAPLHGDVPIGAVVLTAAGEVVARSHNEPELTGGPTGHPEVLALRRAAEASGSWRLDGHTLVVTLGPGTMGAGALVPGRVGGLGVGAGDPKAGAVSSVFDVVRDPRLNHRVEVIGGIESEACARLLREFFKGQR